MPPLRLAGGHSLPEPTHQFSDFARWQIRWSTSEAATQQLAYWKRHLRDASSLFPTAENIESALLCSRIAHEPVRIEKTLVARLRSLSHRRGATLFMTLLAGFKTLLMARSGRNDVCVATAMANRSQLSTERVIGPLVNTTLIRTRIDCRYVVSGSAQLRTRLRLGSLRQRKNSPSISSPPDSRKKTVWTRSSLIQVSFILQNAFRPLKLPDVTVRSFAYPGGQRVLPIDRSWLSVMLRRRHRA